jgi:hypothetical protein
MSKVITKLHPSIREHHRPRVSAATLAEYLIMTPDQQERLLHDSRFASSFVVSPHAVALNAIRAYCADPRRSKAILDEVKEALNQRSLDKTIRPKQREESRRCIETIHLFESSENAFGIRAASIESTARYAPMNINGVLVSIQPDLLIKRLVADAEQTGVIFFRPQKAPDPAACRLEETKRQRGEHRREMARYMLAMADMMFADLGGLDRETSIIADIRLGERIGFSTSDHSARVRRIGAACRQINSLWDDIEPRASALAKG